MRALSAVPKIFSLYKGRLRLFSPNIRLFLLGDALVGIGMTFWMLLFNLYLKEFGASLGMDPAQAGVSTGLVYAFFRDAEAAGVPVLSPLPARAGRS